MYYRNHERKCELWPHLWWICLAKTLSLKPTWSSVLQRKSKQSCAWAATPSLCMQANTMAFFGELGLILSFSSRWPPWCSEVRWTWPWLSHTLSSPSFASRWPSWRSVLSWTWSSPSFACRLGCAYILKVRIAALFLVQLESPYHEVVYQFSDPYLYIWPNAPPV